jgi:uncharacterized protein
MIRDEHSIKLPSAWQVCRRAWVLGRTIYQNHPRRLKYQLRWAITVLARQALSRRWFQSLAAPALTPFVRVNPRLVFVPMGKYMSRAWTWDRRAKVVLNTYEFINGMGSAIKDGMTREEGMTLAQVDLGKDLGLTIRLVSARKFRFEGEVSIFFELSPYPGPVAGMAFSLEKGPEGQWVGYVGVVQGRAGGGEDVVKAATKAMHGLRPKFLMGFLAQEIMGAMGVGELKGVGNGIQVFLANRSRLFPAAKKILFDYDGYWREMGGELKPDGWFQLPFETTRRAQADITSHKRSMYRKRYALMDDLTRQIRMNLQKPMVSSAVGPERAGTGRSLSRR